MAPFTNWLKRRLIDVVDPDRDERISELVRSIEQALRASRQQLSLRDFEETTQCTRKDLELAAQEVYQRVLDRAWADKKVTLEEYKSLAWIGKCLDITDSTAQQLQQQMAIEHFAEALSQAMDDGALSDSEVSRLSAIAESIGFSLKAFSQMFFASEGERYMRKVFAEKLETGLTVKSWNKLLELASCLGFSSDDLDEAIRPQAQQYIEHILADAISDDELSEPEDRHLCLLMQQLGMDSEFIAYVEQRLTPFRVIRKAKEKQLPTLPAPRGVAVRAGEIIHYYGAANWRQTRMLKSGPRDEIHLGMLLITDNRLMFCSDSRSFNIPLRAIVAHDGGTGVIELKRTNKPQCEILIMEEAPVAYTILKLAVSLTNQTAVASATRKHNRHIPRDVRQRVWQRYGGRCAECGDSQYLEFDHVIPVARGGSNSDVNVQLLCRKCNLRKSDNI